jgi:hypothetical protein
MRALGDPPSEFGEAQEQRRTTAPSWELRRFMAEIKGQAQFLLYLADQIEESLEQLTQETDECHSAFLCKILGMYSSQLETKHQGLGEKIAEACQEVYVTVREHELH